MTEWTHFAILALRILDAELKTNLQQKIIIIRGNKIGMFETIIKSVVLN